MTHTEAYSRQRFYSAGQLKTTTTMCSQHLPQEPGWTRAPRLRNGGGSFLPQPPSGQRADHLDPGHKPSTLVTGWREAVHLGCHSGGQVTLAESTSWGGEMACRNSSPTSWRDTHTHEPPRWRLQRSVGEADESGRSLEGLCQPGDQRSLTLWPSSSSAGILLCPSLPRPHQALKGTERYQRTDVLPGGQQDLCGPEEGLDHTQDELARTENIQHPEDKVSASGMAYRV